MSNRTKVLLLAAAFVVATPNPAQAEDGHREWIYGSFDTKAECLAQEDATAADCKGIPVYIDPTRPANVPFFIPRELYDATHPSKNMQFIEKYDNSSPDGGADYQTLDGPFPTFKACQAKIKQDATADFRERKSKYPNSDDSVESEARPYYCHLERIDW